MTPPGSLHWRELHWPQPVEPAQALALLRHLAADTARGPVVLEAHGQAGAVRHRIGAGRGHLSELTRTLAHLLPGTLIGAEAKRFQLTTAARLRLHGAQLPLQVERAEDANRAVLAALASTGKAEQAVLQIVLGRGLPARLATPPQHDPTQGWLDSLLHGHRRPSTEVKRRLKAKRAEPGLQALIRVGARAASEQRCHELIHGLLTALRCLQAPGTRISLVREQTGATEQARFAPRHSVRLNCLELAGWLAWPLGQIDAPGLPSPHPKRLRLQATDIDTSRVFATTTAPGQAKALGIGIEDALFHTVLTGPTGTGKSTVLLNLICADLQAGRGVVVIDPKTDLVRDVLERVPPHRTGDVVVLDPHDARPVGFNPLKTDGAGRELAADAILTVFRDLFPSMFGPRTSDVLHASLLTLTQIPGATLAWLPRLLTDQSFRTRHLNLATVDDAGDLGGFWAGFEALSAGQQAQFIGPVLSRLRQFLLRPSLRRVLDQAEPKFDLGRVFTDAKVLLVPLNGGLLGSTATRLLGSLLVGHLWQLTLARASLPTRQRRPVAIYIDETQEFLRLGHDLADALARSRALGVAWHLAHQFRDQFTPEVRAAIDANARNKITFTLSPKDARDLAGMAAGLRPEDFTSLGRFHVYAQLMRHGQALPWASGQTLPPPPATSDPVAIIAASQARWGNPPSPSPHTPKPGPASQGQDDRIGRRRRGAP